MGDDTSRRDTPLWPGTNGPEPAPPALGPGALRRSTALDAVRPSSPHPQLLISGHGRDLLTTATGERSVLHAARLRLAATAGPDPALDTADAIPRVDGLCRLAGAPLGAGFRGRVRTVLPDRLAADPLATLLDDVPALALIARSGPFRTGERPVREQRHPPLDVCAGWRPGGELHRRSGTDDALVGRGPPAPALVTLDGRHPWHDVPRPAPGTFRRVRRLDLAPGAVDGGTADARGARRADLVTVDAMFRDTFVEADGEQSVIHEYRLVGAVAACTRTIVSLVAQAGVLPGPDCVHAAASVNRLVGRSLDEVAASVRRDLAGPVGCTHLTDAVHALAAAAPLLDHVVPTVPEDRS